jgi:spore coat polysaccharide biosynthesis predicted glycosyltransferase SpsG
MVDILICVNASREIGMGHLFRCLNLAKYLRKKYDKEIVFFSLDFKPAIEIIQENHFPVFVYDGTRKQNHELEGVIQETKPKLIINDMLDTEPKMIELQKKYDATVCNFDDTKAGLIFADVTINPLVFHYPEMRGKKPKSLYFYGPDYMILDERFENFRNIRELQNQKCRKILVSMGGTDTWNVSEKVVRALIPLITEKDLDITLSTGPGIQNQEKLCNLIEDVALTNLNCVQDVPWLGQLMAKSDRYFSLWWRHYAL